MESTQIDEATAWFCLVSRKKHEYLAAAQLAEQQAVKVFAPRIRFRRPTRNGLQWATEALFPSYFFAKIGPSLLNLVNHAPAVRGIVHFGNFWPTVPDQTIEELQKKIGGVEIHVISGTVSAGDQVKITEGAFRGIEAIITQVMPARERVTVLLEILGRQTMVQLNSEKLIKNIQQRELLFSAV